MRTCQPAYGPADQVPGFQAPQFAVLEPGETQQLSLAPNTFSAWGKVPDEAVKGSVLELKLITFDDASGKKLGTPETDDTAGRKKALEEGIRTLENKIQ